MSTQANSPGESLKRFSPGDVVAIRTENGIRHVQVTHMRAPYPDVVRAIHPTPLVDTAEQIARGRTAFVAMVELAGAVRGESPSIRVMGHATIPAENRAFPRFRLPIRNRSGEIVYWWTWDGEGLAIAPEADETDLPIREVLPLDSLRSRLSDLG